MKKTKENHKKEIKIKKIMMNQVAPTQLKMKKKMFQMKMVKISIKIE